MTLTNAILIFKNIDAKLDEDEKISAIKMVLNMPTHNSISKLDMLNVIKFLLQKYISKKPTYVDTRFRHHGKHISDGSSLDRCYKCPNCNSHIFHVFDSEKYCNKCGQALDWSEEN